MSGIFPNNNFAVLALLRKSLCEELIAKVEDPDPESMGNPDVKIGCCTRKHCFFFLLGFITRKTAVLGSGFWVLALGR